jgi:hypothetical protein
VPLERETPVPKVHHVLEASEPIAASELLAFSVVQQLTVDKNGKIAGTNPDFLYLYARDASEQARAFVPETRIQVQCVSRLVRVRADRADRVRLLTGHDERNESLLKIVDAHQSLATITEPPRPPKRIRIARPSFTAFSAHAGVSQTVCRLSSQVQMGSQGS